MWSREVVVGGVLTQEEGLAKDCQTRHLPTDEQIKAALTYPCSNLAVLFPLGTNFGENPPKVYSSTDDTSNEAQWDSIVINIENTSAEKGRRDVRVHMKHNKITQPTSKSIWDLICQ